MPLTDPVSVTDFGVSLGGLNQQSMSLKLAVRLSHFSAAVLLTDKTTIGENQRERERNTQKETYKPRTIVHPAVISETQRFGRGIDRGWFLDPIDQVDVWRP